MQIAFIGGGNMATAIVAGLCANGTAPEDIHVSDPNETKRAHLAQTYGVTTHDTTTDWLRSADIVVLATKPQVLEGVCRALVPYLPKQATVLSIAAGVTIEALSRWLEHDRIVRCMPNTPAMVRCGMSGLFAPETIDAATREAIEGIMCAVGRVRWVDSEDGLHVVTGGSGSGPAYVFYFLQGLSEALQNQGMDADTAHDIALSTVEGAARLARESGRPFDVLRANVTSKGGTTAKAIEVFESKDLIGTVDAAVKACIARSKEMSELFK